MRVLVSTTAGTGHFRPVVPFARACAAAGHDVAVAAPASFAAQVDAAGFRHLPFADVPADVMAPVFARLPTLSFDEANRVVLADVFGRLDAQAALPGLRRIIDDWSPDLVLRDPCEFGSMVAAGSAGVAQAMVAVGVSASIEAVEPLLTSSFAELDDLAGVPEGSAATLMHTTPTLTCVPPSLDGDRPSRSDPAGPLHRFRFDPGPTSDTPPPDDWGDPSHPLVFVTFGSVAGGLGHLSRVYSAVLDALADQPVRVLLTTGPGLDPADLAPAPANARVEQWWPQTDVMPHAAAVIGHGGFGTTMATLAAGVPQLVIPLFAFDQQMHGERVAAIGAGLTVHDGPTAIADVVDAVTRLLREPSFRAAARAVADEMAGLPPVGDSVGLLEQIASP